MIKISGIITLLIVVAFTQTAGAQQKKRKYKPVAQHAVAHPKSTIQYGIASFYARKFQGKRTANGEIYDSHRYTAACNLLPLGTWIKVTNLINKKSVIVRINDRMARGNKRLVDLSRSAASSLGFISHGVVKVKIERVPHHRHAVAREESSCVK